jgi:exopolysaccharide biosynthesis protein
MNLDGGGSTTLAVNGHVANGVHTERAVSDALVWLPKS